LIDASAVTVTASAGPPEQSLCPLTRVLQFVTSPPISRQKRRIDICCSLHTPIGFARLFTTGQATAYLLSNEIRLRQAGLSIVRLRTRGSARKIARRGAELGPHL
jgi:hypothetical protein